MRGIGVRAELVEGQEELVPIRPLLQADHGADVRQRLAERTVVRVVDRRVERSIGLADVRLAAVHADPEALDRDAARAGRRIEADEGRLVEQVAVAVVLCAKARVSCKCY